MLEINIDTISPDMEREYELDNIDLPPSLFDDLDFSFKDRPTLDCEFESFCEVFDVEEEDVFESVTCRFTSFIEYLTIDDEPTELFGGVLSVKCKFCGGHFLPTYSQAWRRVQSLKGQSSMGSESSFYCSETCKDSCPIYRSKSNLNISKKISRDSTHTKQVNKMALERANNKCEICGSEEKL